MSNLSNFLVVQKKALSKNLSIKYMGKKIPITATHFKEYLQNGMPYIVGYTGKSNHIGWEYQVYNLKTKTFAEGNKVIALDYLTPKFGTINSSNVAFERHNDGYIIKEADGRNVLLTQKTAFKDSNNHKLFFDHISRSEDGTINKAHVYEIKNNKYTNHFLVGANKMFGGTKNLVTGEPITNPYELLHSVKYSGYSYEGEKIYHGSFSKKEFFAIINNYFKKLIKTGKQQSDIYEQKVDLFVNLEAAYREFSNCAEDELAAIDKKLIEEQAKLLNQYESQKDNELEGRYANFEEYLNDDRYKTQVTHNYNYHKIKENGRLVKLRADVHEEIKKTILSLRNEVSNQNDSTVQEQDNEKQM